MTNVKMYYFTPISDLTGKREECLTFSNRITIQDLLNNLIALYGNPMRRYFYNNTEGYDPKCLILINQSYTNQLDRIMIDGDTVSLVPPLGGG